MGDAVVIQLGNKTVGGGKTGDGEGWWEQSRWHGIWDIYPTHLFHRHLNLEIWI